MLRPILEWIAEKWFPTDVIDIDQWVTSFLEPVTWSLLMIAVLVYLLFLFLFPRNKIKGHKDIFGLRGPFYLSLILIIGIQIILILIIGLGGIGDEELSGICVWAVITGILSALLFWIMAIIYSPPRLRYTPWLRYRVCSRFRRFR
ncbi:MAG: hypothetical protein ACE5EA_06350 [Nitrospirota bacterium]